MRIINSQNPVNTYRIKNKWLDGFTAFIYLFAAGGGFLGASKYDLTKLQLKATLLRQGSEVVLFNTTLRNLVTLSHLLNPIYNYVVQSVSVTSLNAGNTIAMAPIRFDLGGPLNLEGNDELVIEWQLGSDFFQTGGGVDLTQSYIQLDETESTEVEFFTPITETKVIEVNQANPSYSLGDNVMTVVFSNYDKTDIYLANAVVNFYNMSALACGQSFSKKDNYNELLDKAWSYYPTIAEAAARLQTFLLYSGNEELDQVQIDFNLNSANVTGSNNWLLYRRFITSDWLVTRGTILADNKKAKADKKGSYRNDWVESERI